MKGLKNLFRKRSKGYINLTSMPEPIEAQIDRIAKKYHKKHEMRIIDVELSIFKLKHQPKFKEGDIVIAKSEYELHQAIILESNVVRDYDTFCWSYLCIISEVLKKSFRERQLFSKDDIMKLLK